MPTGMPMKPKAIVINHCDQVKGFVGMKTPPTSTNNICAPTVNTVTPDMHMVVQDTGQRMDLVVQIACGELIETPDKR